MDGEPFILLLYVDDLFLDRNEKLITGCKKKLDEEFEMKDIGLMHYFLGMDVWQRSKGTFLNQGKYPVELLKIFYMLDCKSMDTPNETNLVLLSDET